MKQNYQVESSAVDIIKISAIIIPGLLVFLSFLYLFTYYHFFEVNIFNYISINTIVSYSVQSIGLVILVAIAGYSVLFIYDFLLTKLLRTFLRVADKHSLFENKLRLVFVGFIYIALIIGLLYLFNFYSVDLIFHDIILNILVKEALLLFLLGAIFLSISNSSSFSLKPSHLSFKTLIVSVVLITSILTISKALLDVIQFNNDEYKYVLSSDLKGAYPEGKLKLIGKADDHYFLKYPDETTVIIKQYGDFERLHLRTFRNTTDTD